ncbi:hypothetical protein WUBG_03228 [Wuchereria bancrofti]|uniref:Uncharacterized protein n=1 Tax=Wuchereria bancrofti TaxID=6293 RepID=J9ETF7_WUCBA|nr:hypothetical protein WUBG_03228 [Wuchereria bancrofti]
MSSDETVVFWVNLERLETPALPAGLGLQFPGIQHERNWLYPLLKIHLSEPSKTGAKCSGSLGRVNFLQMYGLT